MSDMKIQGEVTLDTTNADAALINVEKGANRMADSVAGAGKKAGQGLSEMGEGGDVSAAKVDKATSSIIASIKRTTAALEAGGRDTKKYYETIAAQRGISPDALRPYLEQLENVRQSQNKVGVSAAQTAAAMRNVPAQFTDIVVSLQSGQQPLTVLLQQGGQLKDMFGGIGPAAKALGSYVMGMVNPLTLAAGAAAGLSYVYSQANNEAKELAKSLIISGNAAGAVADQLLDSTNRLVDFGAATRSAASEALNSLALDGNVAAESIERAAFASVRAQTFVGKAVADTAKEFGELGKSPTASVEKLNDKYHFLTLEVYEQIKALEKQGLVADAAKIAQSSYADALLSQSDKVQATLTDWERGWIRIKTATSGAFSSVMHIFDDPSNQEKIQKLQDEREKLLKSQKRLEGDDSFINRGASDRVQKLLDQNKAEINAIRDKIKAKVDEAKAEEAKNAKVQAGMAWSKEVEKNLSKQEKLTSELTRVRNLGVQAGISEADIETQLANVRENSKEKTKKAIEDQSLAWQNYKVAIRQIGDAEKKILGDTMKSIQGFKAELLGKEITDGIAKQGQEFLRLKKTADEYRESLADNAELMALEAGMMGDTSMARSVAIEQFKVELALRKELRRIASENISAGEKLLLSDQARESAQIAKSQAGLKAQQDEWTKFYADIYNGLSDSLYRGFEAGKGFFQSFWDGIKNLFKTTVLKFAVQGVMTGILGFGAAGQANAAQTNPLAQAFNAISTGKSLWDGFAAAGAAMNGGVVNALSSGIGSLATLTGSNGGFLSSLATGLQGAGAGSGVSSALGLNLGSSIATAMPYAMAAAAAFALSKGINGSFRLGGLSADAGALFGVAPRLFGMQDKQMAGQTITGNLGTDDLMRNVSWTQKGGLFRSDRSGVWSYGLKDSTAIQDGKAYQDTANLQNDQGYLKYLNDSYSAIKTATQLFAKTLGLNADEITARNDAIRVSLGATAEETKANLDKALNEVSNTLASSVLGGLASLKAAGEDSNATLVRLADVVRTTDQVIAMLGGSGESTFGKLSEQSISARDAFVKLNGGIDALKSTSDYFAQNFLTDAERLAPVAEDLHKRMSELGYGSVGTVEGFKALVKSLDLTNASQAGLYAELMKLAPAFKAVTDAAKTGIDAVTAAKTTLESAQSAYQAALRAVGDSIQGLSKKAVATQLAEANARDRISQAYFAAQDALSAAQQRVVDITRASAEAMNRFSTNIKAFVAGLGGNIPGKSYETLKASLQTSAVLAQGGDAKSQADLTAIAQQFLNAAKDRSFDAASYARDEAAVKLLLSSVADAVDSQVKSLDVSPVASDLELANKDILAAQKALLDVSQVAAATGANTDRTLVQIAGSSAALLDEFRRAQAENLKAQVDLASAKALTATLQIPDLSSMSGFYAQLANLSTAKDSLDKAQAGLNAEILAAAKKATQSVTDFATSLGLSGDGAALLAKAMSDAHLTTDGFKALMSVTGLSAKDLAVELTSSGASAADMAIILARAGTDGERLADRLRLAGISAEEFAAMLRANGLQADSLSLIFDTSKAAAKVLADSLGVPGTAAKTLADALASTSLSSLDYKQAMERAGTSIADLNVILKSSSVNAADLFTLLGITGGSASLLSDTLKNTGLSANDLARAFGVVKTNSDALTELLKVSNGGINAEDLAKSIQDSQKSSQDFFAILGAAKISASNLSEIVQVTGLSAAAILAALGTSDTGLAGISIAAGGSLQAFILAAQSSGLGMTQLDNLLRSSGLTVASFNGIRALTNSSAGELAAHLNLATVTGSQLAASLLSTANDAAKLEGTLNITATDGVRLGFIGLGTSLGLASDATNEMTKLLKSFKLPELMSTTSLDTASKSLAQQVVEDWYKTNPNAIKKPDLEGLAYWVQEIERSGLVAAKTAFAASVALTTKTKAIPIDQFSLATNASPPAIATTASSAQAVVDELKALRAEVASMRSEQTAGDLANIAATNKTTSLLQSVVEGEVALTTTSG